MLVKISYLTSLYKSIRHQQVIVTEGEPFVMDVTLLRVNKIRCISFKSNDSSFIVTVTNKQGIEVPSVVRYCCPSEQYSYIKLTPSQVDGLAVSL